VQDDSRKLLLRADPWSVSKASVLVLKHESETLIANLQRKLK
jgi:hypothetical protein